MQDRIALMSPEPISRFASILQEEIPAISLEMDRPADPQGEWWLDLTCQGFRSHVAWRPGRGFGVFTSDRGYTDQPDEVYRSPELATRRIQQLYRHWKSSSKLQPLSLADIRELRGTRQTGLAAALQVDQAAISRFEHRENMKLSSLHAYFRAMGGRLVLRVHFDGFDATLSVLADREAEAGETPPGAAEPPPGAPSPRARSLSRFPEGPGCRRARGGASALTRDYERSRGGAGWPPPG